MTDRRAHCIVITGASAGIGQALERVMHFPSVLQSKRDGETQTVSERRE
ncbi:hypothetical protein R6138_00001 [Ralstonia thomasii]|nr:hypothetical protein R6138_00001 [Ralstonia sp. LMG 18095]